MNIKNFFKNLFKKASNPGESKKDDPGLITEYDFISLDIEALNSNGGVSSLGIAAFKDGKLVETFYSLIHPENDKENKFCTRVSGISLNKVKDAPTIKSVWPNIKHYFNFKIIGHNLSYDLSQLNKLFSQADIDFDIYKCKFEDTLYLSKDKLLGLDKYSLDKVATAIGLSIENHHNSLEDAILAGNVYIKLLKQEESIDFSDKKIITSDEFKFTNYNVELNKTEFELSGKNIVLTGIFEKYLNRDILLDKLYNLGCIINKSILKKTEVLIVGEDSGPSKIKLAKERNLTIITEQELYNYMKIDD